MLRCDCHESLDEKIHALVRRNLSYIKDIPPLQQLPAHIWIVRQALVYFHDVRHDEVSPAPDCRQLLCDRLRPKLGIVDKIRDQRHPHREQSVASAQVVKVMDYSS